MSRGNDDRPKQISHRSLIQRAVIVGGVAWTAPVIIDSVASPAGALTVPGGCYRMWVGFTAGGAAWPAWQSSPPADACLPGLPSPCTPGNSTAAAAAVTISPST